MKSNDIENLKKVYIQSIDLDNIFHSGKLVDAAQVLLNLQEDFQIYYKNISFDFDKNNDTALDVYGYRTETDEEIMKRTKNIQNRQAEDYKLYLELKERFEDLK